jgi:hypothetical protein
MAGQARRGTRGTRRSSRDGSSAPVLAAASAVASGSATASRTARSRRDPDPTPITKSTYRSLLLRGLAPDEAANLTAFMAGIHAVETPWTIRQINQLLFLREMQRAGQVGHRDDGLTT